MGQSVGQEFINARAIMTFIEQHFPVEMLNQVALSEGNSKKPVYRMHKWWARRLGSVFRAIVLSVFGDKEKLRQVFVNLIQNAIKYTESGSVLVIAEVEEKFCKITVKDTGIGIPEGDLNRIFERFYRVDKARSRAVGGTGLGLAIVKHIIEAHDSKIEVKSKLNEGTEFSFRLKK